jgi:hypothetical protein
VEIVKVGMALSADSQADFIDTLDAMSDELRKLLQEQGAIRQVEINHGKAWRIVKGSRIGFVDGGMANVAGVGSAPLALRVGSYVVVPGDRTDQREEFGFEVQLVDDLYVSKGGGGGVYEDYFADLAKLRDAARISSEVAGLLALGMRSPAPDIVFLHGPLVNPVSPYALGNPDDPDDPDAFPNFTQETIEWLLPGEGRQRTGREANFVAVYLEQLNRLKAGEATIAGVVERPSPTAPGPLISGYIEKLHEEGKIDAPTRRVFLGKIERHRLTDSILFECILDEGEFIAPLQINKQGPKSKIPVYWASEIGSYPKPLVTYVKSHVETLPIRVESFDCGPLSHPELLQLVVHMSRLLPKYSFPVGLDIVDRHAKIPEWMSRQMNVMLSAQLMRRAMDSGNPAIVRSVRRILSAGKRDWLFRPDFRKG